MKDSKKNGLLPTLLNGATGTIKYMKDSMGFVHFKGNVLRATAGLSVFSLPVGYRGAETLLFASTTTGGSNGVTQLVNGFICYVDKPSTSNVTFSFDGLTFKAEV